MDILLIVLITVVASLGIFLAGYCMIDAIFYWSAEFNSEKKNKRAMNAPTLIGTIILAPLAVMALVWWVVANFNDPQRPM